MKFDFAIGNPPYQESRETTKDMPVYNDFMDAAYEIADKVELITPGRFLFNAGATSKKWNQKMLNDTHFKVLEYTANSDEIFSNTDIKGGVAIHYYDHLKKFEPVDVFSSYQELNSIRRKVCAYNEYTCINSIMYPYSTYTLSDGLWNDFPKLREEVEYISKNRDKLKKEDKEGKLSNLRIITTNIFDLLNDLFFDNPQENDNYCCIVGRKNNSRCYKWIKASYIDTGENYPKWKVIVTAVNGAGKFGEVLSEPFIEEPFVGYTQTFLGIGSCDEKNEAEAILKYIKSKFARTLLGILKITQHNPPEKWKYVPLQDFTSSSDIDWSKSIPEIDQQLYRKYGLTEEEIEFIETHVKLME